MSPSVRTFGKYLLDEEIARGGMSRVFLARLRGLGGFEKRLIVKQVLPELASDPRFVAMFVTEAKTLVQMSHPHIAPVYELGVVDGVYFLAMEYVEGATLAQILTEGPLAPGLAAHLGAEICDALHYAHARFEIIHRDVTPRNVIVDSAGHSRLLDFGIAAPAEAEKGAELFGTPGYLSPEQLRGDPLGPPSDVFSLGAVLFEALTGRRAFPGNTVDVSREELAAEGPRFEGDEAPAELREIVERTMRRDPEARFATARELGRALRGWLASHAPEGVGPELGVRAEHAEPTREERQAARLSKPNGEATGADAEVKTLATSRLLDDLMEGRPASVPPPGRSLLDSGTLDLDADDAEASGTVGTVPIDGRRSTPEPEPPDGDEPRTAAIVGRRSAPEASETSEEEEDEGEEEAAPAFARHGPTSRTEPRPPAPHFNDAWWLATAVVAILGALTWALWPSGPPRETDPTARLDQPPREGDAMLFAPDAAPLDRDAGDVATADAGVGTAPDSGERTVGPGETDPVPAPARTATLTVNAIPWGTVILDGHTLGNTPVRGASVRTGHHLLVVRNEPLAREARASFDAEGGQTITVIADLNADPPEASIRAR